MGAEDDITAVWHKINPIPISGGGFWPREGPPTMSAAMPLPLAYYMLSVPNVPITPQFHEHIIFSYEKLFNTQWHYAKYAIYGQYKGVKIQVDGPTWPEP